MISKCKFTLVEVLVATSITAVVLSVISAATWSTLRTVDATGRRADMSRETGVLVRRISEDLMGCRYEVTLSRAELDMLRDREEEPPAFYAESEDDHLLLNIYTTAAITGPSMPAGVYKVFYRFSATDGKLERRQANIAQVELDEISWRVLSDDVEYIKMRFYDGEEWMEEWNSNDEGALPLLVEVAIGLQRDGISSRREFMVSPRIRERQ